MVVTLLLFRNSFYSYVVMNEYIGVSIELDARLPPTKGWIPKLAPKG
jgi:hypothetical protein